MTVFNEKKDPAIFASLLLACDGSRAQAAAMFPSIAKNLQSSFVKSAVENTGAELAVAGYSVGAFFDGLKADSFFSGMYPAMRRAKMGTRTVLNADAVIGSVKEPGQNFPVSKMNLLPNTSTPRTAGAIVAVSDKIAREVSAQTVDAIDAMLRSAIGLAVDKTFIDEAVDSATPTFLSTGAATLDILADIKNLFDEVNVEGAGKMFWVANRGIANLLATRDANGAPAFQGLMPTGVSEFFGLPFWVSDQAPVNSLMLFDAASFAADYDPKIVIDVATQGALQMSDSPTEGEAEMVSLYQTNTRALRARMTFAFSKLRDSGVAVLTDIGGASGDV